MQKSTGSKSAGFLAAALVASTCLALATPAAAAEPAEGRLQWVRQLGTTLYASYTSATGVATDAAGNIYVGGWTDGSLARQNPTEYSPDAWLAKYNNAGYLLWKRQLGTATDDNGTALATDAAGNVYIGGNTWGSLPLYYSNRGGRDAWVAKYDTSGHQIWRRQFGTGDYDDVYGLATDAAGNLFIAGETSRSIDGPNVGGFAAWVTKYDSTGRRLWMRRLGTIDYDITSGVATDTAGNVYISGWRNSPPSADDSDQDTATAWVAKYDADGHHIWKRYLEYSTSSGVATDATGNVYLVGRTNRSVGGPNQGDVDAVVAKFDASGHRLWVRQLGFADYETTAGVATDAAGSVYITGRTLEALGGPIQGVVYRTDVWLAKYDANGNLQWTEKSGSPESDEPSSVVTFSKGGRSSVYVAGITFGSFGGELTGAMDAFVIKYLGAP